jgi:transcriptional regulator with XRE-family HTH domain
MADDEPRFVADLGERLRDYRRANKVSQVDLAAALGVSQPYLSRIETGARPALRLAFLRRVSLVLAIPPHDLGLEAEWLADSEAEELYERSLISIGANDFANAESILLRIASQSSDLLCSPYLRAKAQQRLGHIRRDRNELEGVEGALNLYRSALDVFVAHGAGAAARETRFVMGACHEMRDNFADARRAYLDVKEMAINQASAQGEVRASIRLGVLRTKEGAPEDAVKDLDAARRKSLSLDDSFPYSFSSEKLAIATAKAGDTDKALDLVQAGRAEIPPADTLRLIQSHTAAADIAFEAGDSKLAILELSSARALAIESSYLHQLDSIAAILLRIEASS